MNNRIHTTKSNGYSALLGAALLFGFMPILVNMLMPYASDTTIILGRYVISTITLLFCIPITRMIRESKNRDDNSNKADRSFFATLMNSIRIENRRDRMYAYLSGVFLGAYAFAFIRSLDVHGSAHTLIWTYTSLILTTTVADGFMWLHKHRRGIFHNKETTQTEQISKGGVLKAVFSILILFVGLIFSEQWDWQNFSILSILSGGISWGALSGILFGLRAVLNKVVVGKEEYKTVTDENGFVHGKEEVVLLHEQFATALVVLFVTVATAFIPNGTFQELFHFGFSLENTSIVTFLLRIIMLGAICTAFANISYFKGLAAARDASTAKTITVSEIIFGLLVLDAFAVESMILTQFIGTLLIVVAIGVKADFFLGLYLKLKPIKCDKRDGRVEDSTTVSNVYISSEHQWS